MQCLLLYHCNDDCMSAIHGYVTRNLAVFLKYYSLLATKLFEVNFTAAFAT